FVAFAGVQATIEEEARARAEAQAAVAASSVLTEGGFPPHIEVREGEGIKVVREYLAAHAEVAALVLGSARDGAPGPLVTHFSSHGIGDLPCPLMIVPGGLAEADIDRLS
ncbi:MAG TPA: universal stress protein, partial [Novosphingobium sp.]|nr:universal stress protein [Novosphingobium sp.]